MYRILGIILALALCVGCGSKSPTQPTTPPSTTPPATSAAPVAAVQVKVDDVTTRDAIAALSDVLVDGSASTGTGLTFAIDFGDGATATTAAAKHVYASPSTYTITATVTDSQGRKASATAQIVVRAVTGKWFQAGVAAKTRRVEVRHLSIDAQSGTTVRGSYGVDRDAARTFTGTLIAPRDIRMTTSDGVSLIGTLPGRLNDGAVPWTLIANGDSADGQRLDFHAIVAAPDGPAPDANIRVSWDDQAHMFAPIAGLTPVRVDGTSSRGTGLMYFLEFGDGFVSTSTADTHALQSDSGYFQLAQLTVVDAFGRADTERATYSIVTLGDPIGNVYWMDQHQGLTFIFRAGSGRTYSGIATHGSGIVTDATATLSGTRDVRIVVPAWGAEFSGTIDMSDQHDVTMTVLQTRGDAAGRTYRLQFRDSY